MSRPRLFLSAVSEELRTARQAMAATVRTLGFDPVSQDDFPTGYGELRQWLRTQIDSCEGLIQLVGQGYGAEPSEVDPEYGRVSYTQLEFFYASQRNKKTWVIVIDKDFGCDKPPAQLDLPRDTGRPDPTGYQAERRMLQESYLARLKQENHLRHTAHNATELDNIVLRMRDELGELRRQWEEWLRKDDAFKARTMASLAELTEAARLTTEKIRAHLLQTTNETHRRELAEAEAERDWKRRQQLREATDNAHSVRLSRIEDLAVSFAEIEGHGRGTNVFQEMTRILAEQGVDEAIAYAGKQKSSILKTVRTRAEAARDSNRVDLQPLLRTAALHQAKGQTAKARTLHTEILAVEPDWPEALHAFFWLLIDQGDFTCVRGTLTAARREYEEALRIAQRLTCVDFVNTEWQRDLSVAFDRLGDMAVTQGRLAKAVQIYRNSLVTTKALAKGNLSNTQLQRDLSVSYEKMGDVAVAQGQLENAARVYRDSLAIARQLAAGDPSNSEWQRDLSVSYDRLGDLAVAQGKLQVAARAYSDGLTIVKALAAGDPSNNDWQRDLSVSYDRLGDLAVAQGKLQVAAQAYGNGLAIRKALAAGDPSNSDWQRDLSISYDRLGDVAVAQGELQEAARAYGKGLAIVKALAAGDPSNSEWQRDLWVSYLSVADLARRQKNFPRAQIYWKRALDVLVGIDKQGLYLSPEDRQWLRKLRRKVGARKR